ncbi:MAG: bestrophin family ion channel [Gemmataceae bacterium]
MTDPQPHFLDWFWPPSIARRLWPAVLCAALYTAGVCLVYHWQHLERPVWADQVGVVNALVVGVLVGFRTKAAYDRWWEGRILWGELTNQSRNLCLKSDAFVNLTGAERAELAKLVAGFPIALMRHLRSTVKLQEVPGFESEAANPRHVPAWIAEQIIAIIGTWRNDGRLDGHRHQMLDLHTSAFMNVCGACERIRGTPLPGAFLALLRHGLILGFLAAPWHLAASLGAWAIVVQAVLVYFLFGIELTAEEVEQPFAFDPNDLPLEKYCENIAKSANEILT